jgi:hypothetical protein
VVRQSLLGALVAAVVLAAGAPAGGTTGPRIRADTVSFGFWPAGHGVVTATPENGTPKSCGPDPGDPCAIDVENGTKVTLTATAEPGSTFKHWSTYGCDDDGPCVVIVEGDSDMVTATFSPLRLEVIWAGTGTVEAQSGEKLACDVDPTGGESQCTASLEADTVVVLKATPGVAGESIHWGEGCEPAGGDPTSATCTVVMTNTRTFATLAFGDFIPPMFPFQIAVTIHVARGGSGQGTVKGSGTSQGNDWSVDCPSTCAAQVIYQSTIRLVAQESSGSTFVRWEHVCGTNRTCAFSAGSATRVRAIFDAKGNPPPPPPPPCSPLSPQLRKVTKSGTGARRAITAVVVVRDAAHAVLALVGRRTLASRSFELDDGRNTLRLPVPRRVKPGWYHVQVKLTRTRCSGAKLTRPIRLGR